MLILWRARGDEKFGISEISLIQTKNGDIFTKTQKLGMSYHLFRPSAVYEVKTSLLYLYKD